MQKESITIDYYVNDPYWKEVQSYLPEENRLTEDALPEEYFLPVDDCSIHIDHYKPAAPKGKVILFHGVGGNGRLLSFIALPLMKSGLEVICPDMPPYGYTQYERPVTYAAWVACGSKIVQHYQSENALPTFLFGLSAGGMLAYQVACECSPIIGLIVTCILDQRNKLVVKSTARIPLFGMLAKPLLAFANRFAGNINVPMKWISNMKAITNNSELAALLMKDKKSSGARVSLSFLHAMLHPVILVEPESFHVCPVLLVHPGDDRWTDIKLSNLFYARFACEKETVILDGAGHFPIERSGLKQLEAACTAFIERQLHVQTKEV